MAQETTVKYVCDKCGTTDTLVGGRYNFDLWVCVRATVIKYHHPYVHDELTINAIYCPNCGDEYSKQALLIDAAKRV